MSVSRHPPLLFLAVVVVLASTTSAWVIQPQSNLLLLRLNNHHKTCSVLHMSDNKKEGGESTGSLTFEDAERELRLQEDTEEVEELDEASVVPNSDPDTVSTLRDAIRERTSSLGVEEAVLSKEYVKAARQRALEGRGSKGNDWAGIDLSKISQEEAPPGPDDDDEEDDDLMNPFKNPFKGLDAIKEAEESMTEEMKRETDPLMYEPWNVQVWETFKSIDWPTLNTVLIQVVVLFVGLFVACFTVIKTDLYSRKFFEFIGAAPTQDEIVEYIEAQKALVQELSAASGGSDAAAASSVDAATSAAADAAAANSGGIRMPTLDELADSFF
uniref:Transmembrane protein n=1 Tax=Grammatophora oceanica TaxID=210454 RepID=A0A7S1UPP0_9STRA|mmetsp:Transcript_16233/g.24025  ORF Transcript_16233/g.24025 Transcript_16233/m.24025 type:complete len:328 (+) Transcript_16233:621-1604(+)